MAALAALALTPLWAAQRPRTTPAPRTTTPVRPPPTPAREAAVPFRVGETLTYDVSWSQFLTAGTAICTVTGKKAANGSTAYSIVADGRPVPLVARFFNVAYRMETLLDSFTALSQAASLRADENGRTRRTTARFDRRARRAYYETETDRVVKQDFAVPPDVQDGLATLYAVRGRAFRAGEHFTIPVADDGALYQVALETLAPGPVRVPLGDVSAWNLKLTILDATRKPVTANTAIWITNDARRLPVRLQSDLPLGTFVLALREARP